MSEDGFNGLGETRLAIIGLGLMGGSLALALRGKCAWLAGFDPDPQAVNLANQRAVVDHASTDLGEVVPGSDLIILAAPVLGILKVLQNLDNFHPGRAVVLDLGSTKTRVVEVMTTLPERFDPLGGHPMCGKEKASLRHADPLMFRGAIFALTPLPRTSQRAKDLARELVEAVGSHALWLDSDRHDRWVAATSHLPFVLANALALATPLEAAPLVGPGFHSATRLAGDFAPMMLDVLQTNRENILAAMRAFRSSLEAFELYLEQGDFAALESLLQKSARQREKLVARESS